MENGRKTAPSLTGQKWPGNGEKLEQFMLIAVIGDSRYRAYSVKHGVRKVPPGTLLMEKPQEAQRAKDAQTTRNFKQFLATGMMPDDL